MSLSDIKILKTDGNGIIKQIYLMLLNDADDTITYHKLNWAYQMISMLENSVLANLWFDPKNDPF